MTTQTLDTRNRKTMVQMFALALGMTAAFTIVLGTQTEVEVLMIANALGYGIGVSARNAGRAEPPRDELTSAHLYFVDVGNLDNFSLV